MAAWSAREALWDHVTMDEQERGFKAGDAIQVLEAAQGLRWGRSADREAWFPASFVRVSVLFPVVGRGAGAAPAPGPLFSLSPTEPDLSCGQVGWWRSPRGQLVSLLRLRCSAGHLLPS